MKKKILTFLAVVAVVAAGLVTYLCVGDKEVKLNPENLIALDREEMFTQYAEDYRWYETTVVYQDYLDGETDGTIAGITNVFQAVKYIDESSADVFVITFTHTLDGNTVKSEHGFYVGNHDISNEPIALTFQEAFDRLMATNTVKPHSRYVVLRKEIGPAEANTQYIFGNPARQVYVDAVTGDVSEENPAFKGFELQKPLGEWP